MYLINTIFLINTTFSKIIIVHYFNVLHTFWVNTCIYQKETNVFSSTFTFVIKGLCKHIFLICKLLSRLYILTRLHRINIGIRMTIAYRNKTHACIYSNAWHTRVVEVTCHQRHMHKDEGKLWYWRHPFGFTPKLFNVSQSFIRTIFSNLYALYVFLLLLFFHFNFIFLLFSFSCFSPWIKHRSVSKYKPKLVPTIFSFLTCVCTWHICSKRPFEIAAVIHRGCFEFMCETWPNSYMKSGSWNHPWPCIRHLHRFVFSLFFSSLESSTIFSFSFCSLLALL